MLDKTPTNPDKSDDKLPVTLPEEDCFDDNVKLPGTLPVEAELFGDEQGGQRPKKP